jgi:hypothetical protein
MRKITYEQVKQIFEDRGYELLSTEYLGCYDKLSYICPKHRDEGMQHIDWTHLSRGQGCKYCGKENKRSGREKDLDDYNAKELTESKGLEFVKITREDSVLYVYYICPKHRFAGIQRTPLASMRKKKIGCPYCIGWNKTTELFRKEIIDIHPNIQIRGEYISADTPIECRCLIDGTIWAPTPNRLLGGCGCPECGRIASNKNSTKSNDQFLLELSQINPDVLTLEEYIQAKLPMRVMCKKCGHRWLATPDNLLHGGCCSECSATPNEKKLGDILVQRGFKLERQKKYSDCRDQLPLPFDIYLSEHNILIEYDGEQHYRPVNFGGISDEDAYKNFLKTQYHDSIKTQYCEANNIPLIRVPYWEKDNLEEFVMLQLQRYISQDKMIVVNNW